MKYDVNRLLELSKTCKKSGVMISDSRYALKEIDGDYFICDGNNIYSNWDKVERTIDIYGDDIEDAIISVDYNLVDIPMFSSRTIKSSGLVPLHSKDIPNLFKIAKTVIRHHNVGDDLNMVRTEVVHIEEGKRGKTLKELDKAKKFLNYIEKK